MVAAPLSLDDTSPHLLGEQITTAVQETSAQVAKQVAAQGGRKWYAFAILAAILVAAGVSLTMSILAINDVESARATIAARQVAEQRAQDNLTSLKAQIVTENAKLAAQGKPPVPLPTNATDASSQLALAKTMETFPNPARIVTAGPAGKDGQPGVAGPAGPQGEPGLNGVNGTNGKDGAPPEGWTAHYPDGSTQTCNRASPFDQSHPFYVCSSTGGAATAPRPAPRTYTAPSYPMTVAPLVPQMVPINPMVPYQPRLIIPR